MVECSGFGDFVEAKFLKLQGGHLVPASDEDKEVVDKIKTGEIVNLKFTRMRNYQFFKKWWALVNFAYDYWEPPELPEDPEKKWLKHVTPEKNLDRFRKDLTILAGYHEATYRLNGDTRIEAKSISFSSMSEDEFEKLYSATVDVVLKHVCTQFTGEMLDQVVDQAMSFAA